MFKRLLLSITIMLMSMSIQAAFSENSLPLPLVQQNTNGDASTTNSSTPPKPLQGSVQKVELGLEKLRDVRLDLRAALKATSSLYEEVTIQPVRIITQPELVGNGTIINIPIGTQPIGPPQPARKERIDLAIDGMKPVIDMLKKNADEFTSGEKQLDLPDSVMTRLKPQLQEWVSTVNTIAAQQNELEQITKAPPYDNRAIAELAVSIEKTIKDLDKIRLVIYKVIRKEGKHISLTKE